jgi:hypothetical protein
VRALGFDAGGLSTGPTLCCVVARAAITCALLWALLALSACSADAVDEVPPTLETSGVFVARQDESEGGYRLFRILDALRVQPTETALFVTVYAVRTDSIEQAREAAKQSDLPLLVLMDLVSERQFSAVPHEIVWFRSLNDEERARVR